MKLSLDPFLNHPLRSAFGVSLLVCVFLIALWHLQNQRFNDIKQNQVELTADYVGDLFSVVVNDHIESLENIKRRIEHTSGLHFDHWEYDAELIHTQKISVRMVQWVDERGIVQKIVPEEGHEQAVGLDIHSHELSSKNFEKMQQDNETRIAPWRELVEGGGAFLVDVPVFYDNEFQGAISAGIDFEELFDIFLIGRKMYTVKIEDASGTLFYRSGPNRDLIQPDFVTEQTVEFGRDYFEPWTIKVFSNSHFDESYLDRSNILNLLLTITLIALIGMVTFFMLIAWRTGLENKKALKEKEVLISEIHHRVKNNLAIVSGLLELQAIKSDNQELIDVVRMTQDRIQSIAGVHELLYQTDRFTDIPFETYLQRLSDHLMDIHNGETRSIECRIQCENVNLSINQAIPLGMLISELITNSFKHAFDGEQSGIIEISLKSSKYKIHVDYRDNGDGFDPSDFETDSSIGITIIKTLLKQINAKYRIQTSEGFHLKTSFKRM
jgi:two-component sensor histidine kinase